MNRLSKPLARSGIVRLGIAHAPINQIELRIVRTGAPRRTSALRPRVRYSWATSRNRARRAREWCICATISSRCRDPSRPGIRAWWTLRRPRRKSARRWQRSVRRSSSSRRVKSANFWFQSFLAGLHVEREHMIVDRHAKEFAVIDRRRAPVESGPRRRPVRVPPACARSACPVSTSMANVHLPLTTYMTPL